MWSYLIGDNNAPKIAFRDEKNPVSKRPNTLFLRVGSHLLSEAFCRQFNKRLQTSVQDETFLRSDSIRLFRSGTCKLVGETNEKYQQRCE